MLSKLRKGCMSVDGDDPSCTLSSKLTAARTAVDINRNTRHVSAEIEQYVGASESAVTTDWNQPTIQHSVVSTISFMSSHAAGCSLPLSESVPNATSPGETRPILRPPKKRKINLTSDEGADHCVEPCQTAQFSEVSPPLPRADLTEWKGQRVLARSPTDSAYFPGLIKSITTSHSPIEIQFDGSDETVQMSADSVISDSAPPSSAIFVGMRVCARIGSEQVEYRLGVVRERVLQPPMTKFLVELDACDGGDMKSQVWLSRASLRLLQVCLPIVDLYSSVSLTRYGSMVLMVVCSGILSSFSALMLLVG